ncbi:MAG: ATP-binding cassette domain-containing protein [Solirubrobacteraceae bacterium]
MTTNAPRRSAAGGLAAPAPADAALVLRGISKSFPGVRALDDVDLTCRAGTVHALVGENGSGKSTLVKTACGVLRPDEGTVEIGGQALERSSARAARRLGLQAAYQDTALVPDLSVAENVLLSNAGTAGYLGRLRRRDAERMLSRFDLPIDLDQPVSSLSPGMRQLLEVVRALAHDPRVLLLDEPTATLDAESIARLEGLVAQATAGGAAVLYISHRLDEVERMADEVTVLRDGRTQGTYPGGDWSVPEIVNLMVGASIELTFPDKRPPSGEAPRLEVTDLTGPGFGPVDVAVRPGEVVGIAGAEGNGQRELVRSLVGLRPTTGGRVAIGGHERSIGNPRAAIDAGLRFISGDRVAESIFTELSVQDNGTAPVLDRFATLGVVRARRERRAFGDAADALGIVAASRDQPIRDLSGGNQQKTVMSRALLDPAEVLVVDEPTQGVDAMARLEIYGALRAQADRGTAVIVCSSDSLELAGLCDRVHVVSRGVVTETLSGDDLTEGRIVKAFVSTEGRDTRQVSGAQEDRRSRVRDAIAAPWFPLTALIALFVIVAGYTEIDSGVFLEPFNLTSLVALSLPLIVVAIGQQVALLARGFDISVGAMMTLTVVVASFHVTGDAFVGLVPGLLLVVVIGAAAGLVNGFVVRVLRVNAIIATIGMLGILGGIALMARPTPGGVVSPELTRVLLAEVGWMPVALPVILVIAIAMQVVLMRTGAGLSLRASGFDEESSLRLGLPVTAIKLGAFAACSAIAAIAGLFLAAQTGVGDANVGGSYALLSFAACVIGGASLAGGRGSFVGCVIAGLFLTLLVNVAPILQISPAYSQFVTGVLTLVAVLAYTLNRRGGTA